MSHLIIYKRSSIIIGSIFILASYNGCENSQIPINNGENVEYELCYKKLINDNWEIVLNSIDGNSPINISNNVKEDSDPAWSPDGRYIAFTYFNPIGGTDVYLYDIELDSLINLTPGLDYSARSPLWVPDGERIIFSRHIIGEPTYKYIMDKDGSNKRILSAFQGGDIYFCTDSYHFIYGPVETDTQTGKNVYKTNLDGTLNELLLDLSTIGEEYTNIYDFNPIHEELLILIAETPRITTILANYNLLTKEIDNLSIVEPDWIYLRPKYSPDYSQIAFIEMSMEESISKIAVLKEGMKEQVVRLDTEGEYIDFHPLAFSPGDEYLAYSKNIHQPGEMVWWKSYLYLVDIESKEYYYVDEGMDPQWNPLFSD